MRENNLFLFRHLKTEVNVDEEGKPVVYTSNVSLNINKYLNMGSAGIEKDFNTLLQVIREHEEERSAFHSQFAERYPPIDDLYFDIGKIRIIQTAAELIFSKYSMEVKEKKRDMSISDVFDIDNTIYEAEGIPKYKLLPEHLYRRILSQRRLADALFCEGAFFDKRLRDIMEYDKSEEGKPRKEVAQRHLNDLPSADEVTRVRSFVNEIILPKMTSNPENSEGFTIALVVSGTVGRAIVAELTGKQLENINRGELSKGTPAFDRGDCMRGVFTPDGKRRFSEIRLTNREAEVPTLVEIPFIPYSFLEGPRLPLKER